MFKQKKFPAGQSNKNLLQAIHMANYFTCNAKYYHALDQFILQLTNLHQLHQQYLNMTILSGNNRMKSHPLTNDPELAKAYKVCSRNYLEVLESLEDFFLHSIRPAYESSTLSLVEADAIAAAFDGTEKLISQCFDDYDHTDLKHLAAIEKKRNEHVHENNAHIKRHSGMTR